MKKYLLLVLLALLGASQSRADLMWYEGYNYADGSITNNSTNLWSRHSGTANPSDAIVSNHIEQVFANVRMDDVHRLFPDAYTNGAPIPVFASFTMIVTNLPNATGGYFAHFTDNTSSDFFARIFALTGTAGAGATNFTALPNTFRLGVSAAAAAPNVIFPVDLALNTPYQIVVEYDTANLDAVLWVNPISSGDPSVTTGDAVTSTNLVGKVMQAYAFRQATGMGNFAAFITNLATATTWSDAATNIATTNTPVTPVIVIPPVGFTNFVGSANTLSIVVNGQGQASLTYQWYNGATLLSNPNGNSNIFSFPSAQTGDSGSYTVVVTTPFGLSVTSSPVSVSISAAPVPPTITSQPASTNAYPNQTVTFSVGYTSPGNVSFQWKSNGVDIAGANSQTYTLTGITTNFAASYSVGLTNDITPNGVVSSNAVLTVLVPQVVSINTLRGMVDPVFFLPTNTTSYFTTTGTVVSKTNFTTSVNDECFIDDGTGGISVFYGGAGTFRPNFGDVITVTGPLSQFSSLMEFALSASDPSTSATIISTGNPGPVPAAVVPLTFTNSVAYGGTSNALRTLGSRLLMVTNVTITPNGGTFGANGTYTLTDTNGNTLIFFCYSGFSNLVGTVVPPYAYTITAVASEFLGATVPDRSSGYQLEASEPSDIVTTPPPAVTLSANSSHVISWTAVPYSYPYTIYGSTNVAGPYLPLQTGMVFPTSSASYTDTNVASAKFYRVSSP